MTIDDAKGFVAKHRWWVAACLVAIAGYTFGKDIAFRENARDAVKVSPGAQQ